MATNVNLINDIVLPGSMSDFRNGTVITNAIKPHYDDTYSAFGTKPGAAINLRTHQLVEVREDSFDIDVKGIEQRSVPFTKSKVFGVDLTYTDAELAQDVNGFMEYRVKPIMNTLAAKVDQYVYSQTANAINQAVALPVTNVDSDDILNAGVILDDASCLRDGERTVILSPKGMKQIVSSSSGLFNNASSISQQYNDGIIDVTPTLGFKFGMSQNVSSHTVGAHDGAYLVKTTSVDDATTLDIDTGTGTIAANDIFTIAGVNSVDKFTKQDTGELMQFRNVTASAGGDVILTISPQIELAGPYQNVTALPVAGAAVTVLGTLSTAFRQGLAFHPDFAAVGFCDLEIPSDKGVVGARKVLDNISMRCITGFDIKSSQQYMRWDILMGAVVTEPSRAVRIYIP